MVPIFLHSNIRKPDQKVWFSDPIKKPKFNLFTVAFTRTRQNIYITNILKLGFQMVGLRAMSYELCTRPTIWILDQCIRKQDGVHLSGIQMEVLFGFQIPTVF